MKPGHEDMFCGPCRPPCTPLILNAGAIGRLAVACALAVVTLTATAAGRAGAEPGDLDPTLGSDGTVTTAIAPNAYNRGYALVIQSGGKLVLGGFTQIDGVNHFALVRYEPDGSLDGTFGSGGIVLTPGLFGVSRG